MRYFNEEFGEEVRSNGVHLVGLLSQETSSLCLENVNGGEEVNLERHVHNTKDTTQLVLLLSKGV